MKNTKKKLGKHQDDGDDEDEGDGGVLLVKDKKKNLKPSSKGKTP